MMRILLTLLLIFDLAILALLIFGIIASIKAGGGSILFPGLGLIVSMPLVLAVVFVLELVLVGITVILYRYIKSRSGKLA